MIDINELYQWTVELPSLYRTLAWFGMYGITIAFLGAVHQHQKGEKAWTKSRLEAWHNTIRNLLLVCTFQTSISYFNPGNRLTNDPQDWKTNLAQVVCFVLIEDALFYWSHRGFHSHPKLYRFHAYHHKARKDVCIVNGLQITLVEFVGSIFVPGAIPLLFVSLNRLCFEILCFVAVMGVVCDHGLDVFPQFLIPFPINGVKHHVVHHERVVGNFSGPFAIWDYICNTHIPNKNNS